jgi:hypothetical protein
MSKIETIYEVKTKQQTQTLKVSDVSQNAAKAIDKKFKGQLFRKILKGFNIDGIFYPLELPNIYGRRIVLQTGNPRPHA